MKKNFLLFFLFSFLWSQLPAQTINFDSLIKVCVKQLDEQKNETAIQTATIIENSINEHTDPHIVFRFLGLMAAIEGRFNRYDGQKQYLKKHRLLATQINESQLIAESNIAYASYYAQFNEYGRELPYLLKAVDLFLILGDEIQVAECYNKLGLIQFACGNYNLAKEYFLESFRLYKKHEKEFPKYAYWVQNNLANLGLCYQKLSQGKKALSFFEIAIQYCNSAPFDKERPIGVLKIHRGILLNETEKPIRAISELRNGILICLKPINNEKKYALTGLIHLGSCYTKLNRFKSADSCFNYIQSQINTIKKFTEADLFYREWSKMKEKSGDYKAAYELQNKAKIFANSIDLSQQKLGYQSIFLQHELEKQVFENQLLVQENEYKSLVNIIIATVILFMMVFAGIIYNNYRKSKKQNQLLLHLNKQVFHQKEELEILNYKLETSSTNKSYLVQSIAHDLRTPIGNIISLNGLLEEFLDTNSNEAKEFHSLINNSGKMALNIIDDILDHSFIERGKLQIKKIDTDINQLVQECISLLKFMSEPKKIGIQLINNELLTIPIDKERIRRVFVNLLVNALKFSPRESQITISIYTENEQGVVKIKDQGIGMNQHMISQIFERNTEAGRSGIEKEKTVGIGLSIVKSIVEEHGGSIHVESEVNSGSTFYIKLPLNKKPGTRELLFNS